MQWSSWGTFRLTIPFVTKKWDEFEAGHRMLSGDAVTVKELGWWKKKLKNSEKFPCCNLEKCDHSWLAIQKQAMACMNSSGSTGSRVVLLVAEPSSSWWGDPMKMNFEHIEKQMDIGLVTAQFKLCLIIHAPTRCLTPPHPHSPQWQKPICQCMKTNTEFHMWRWVIGTAASFSLTLGLRITDYCMYIKAEQIR